MVSGLEMATECPVPRPSAGEIQRLIVSLRERTVRESLPYKELITSNGKLIESNDTLRRKQRELELDVSELQVNLRNMTADSPGRGRGENSRKEATLQQRIMTLKEEQNQAISREKESLNKLVQSREDLDRLRGDLDGKDQELTRLRLVKQELQDKLKLREIERAEVSRVNQTMNDEYQALQTTCSSLEEKLRKLQKDNLELITRWMDVKSRDADRINTTNDAENKMRVLLKENEHLKCTLEKSQQLQTSNGTPTTDSRPATLFDQIKSRALSLSQKTSILAPLTPRDLESPLCMSAFVPSKPSHRWDAHEGNVTAIQFSPSGQLTATGGDDKVVKLWDIAEGRTQPRATLRGANAGILCIDFDPQEKLLLASSSDFACRLWSPVDNRLKLSLTGHTNKAMAARFMPDSKVISGSHDRTLKLWDLRSKACIRTIFVGSSCNDLVTGEGSGNHIISGHADKKIRFWDPRSDMGSNEMLLQGKVTSLSLSPDGSQLLSCSKDDTLRLIDLKMHQVVGTLTADGFRVGLESSRACFSPDGRLVAAGSVDGSVFIWNVAKAKLETSIREHTKEVTAALWHPSGRYFLTAERSKRCFLWSEH